MNFRISKAFAKDVAPMPSDSKRIILGVIQEIQSAAGLHDLGDCRKLRGDANLYRIRKGNYRITLSFDGGVVVLRRVLPRGRIYKKHNLW
jgi:mRNA-degrading endonuclease RelE of RelBE toxin-antitoxin system